MSDREKADRIVDEIDRTIEAREYQDRPLSVLVAELGAILVRDPDGRGDGSIDHEAWLRYRDVTSAAELLLRVTKSCGGSR